MTKRAELLLNQLLALDESERAAIIAALDGSLGEASKAAEQAWLIELERRVGNHASGVSKAISLEEARANIERELERRRAARHSS